MGKKYPGDEKYNEALRLTISSENETDEHKKERLHLFLSALNEGLSEEEEANAYLFIANIYIYNYEEHSKAINFYKRAFSWKKGKFTAPSIGEEFWDESRDKFGVLMSAYIGKDKDGGDSNDDTNEKLEDLIKLTDHPIAHQRLGAGYASKGKKRLAKKHWQYIIDSQNKFRNFHNADEYVKYAKENLISLEEVFPEKKSSGCLNIFVISIIVIGLITFATNYLTTQPQRTQRDNRTSGKSKTESSSLPVEKRFTNRCPINMRSKPTPDAALITVLDCGLQVDVLNQSPGLKNPNYKWYYVRTKNGIQGWLFAGERDTWVQKIPPLMKTNGIVEIKGDLLLVHEGVGDQYNVIERLPKGAKVAIKGDYGDWYQVQLQDHTIGYVYKKYIIKN